jgi:hypothetical protein
MFLIVDDGIEQRVYRLDPMGPGTPILIGSGADVAIPFAPEQAAEHHAGVFMSGGHWFVKDMGSETGTFVNGVQARFSTPIIPGDKITLGGDVGGPVMVLSETKPARSEADPDAIRDMMPLPDVPSGDLHESYNPGVQGQLSTYTTPERRRGMSPEAVLAGALVMGVILCIGIFFIYRLNQAKETAITVVTTTPTPATKPAPIKVIVKPAPKPTQPTQAANVPTQPADPHAGDPDWAKVDEAHRLSPPPIAILAYDDYVSRHPNSEWQSQLATYTDEALDRIWWQRLKDVMTEQAELRKRLHPLDDHLKELNSTSSDPKRKQELTDQIAEIKKQLKELEDEQFVEMKYTLADVPDVYDSARLDELRKQRDEAAYEAWKKEVLTSIRKTRGSLPW